MYVVRTYTCMQYTCLCVHAVACMRVCVRVNVQPIDVFCSPALTWRDMQNLVVETSRIPNTRESGWVQNGAGYHVHHRFGFGAIDCGRLVEAAQNWRPVTEQHICEVEANNEIV